MGWCCCAALLGGGVGCCVLELQASVLRLVLGSLARPLVAPPLFGLVHWLCCASLGWGFSTFPYSPWYQPQFLCLFVLGLRCLLLGGCCLFIGWFGCLVVFVCLGGGGLLCPLLHLGFLALDLLAPAIGQIRMFWYGCLLTLHLSLLLGGG